MLLEAYGGRWAQLHGFQPGACQSCGGCLPGTPSLPLPVGWGCRAQWALLTLLVPILAAVCSGAPSWPSSHFVSTVTVPLPPFHVVCPAAYLLRDQVHGPGTFHLHFLPWVLEGWTVCGAVGVQEARQSCRNQAVPGSGPWEEHSVQQSLPIPGALLCPPLPPTVSVDGGESPPPTPALVSCLLPAPGCG